MEFLIEVILSLIWDFIFYACPEVLFRVFYEPFAHEKDRSPVWVLLGYITYGVLLGLLSLWIFPNHLLKNILLRQIALFVSPILVGILMAKMGAYREKKGKERLKLDTFLYAAVFAGAFGVTRFVFAK